jgi:succinyl-CoA synthetase alpha subunit
MLGAAEEAMRAGIRLLVIYTERVPVHDAVRMVAMAREARCRVVGPNSAGLMSPELANVSDMRTVPMIRGPVGVVSKSGTLSYELIAELARRGVGVSTVVCVGGDPVLGTTQAEVLQLFAADSETAVVALIGEPGGQAEVEAGRLWSRLGAKAPLVGLMVGKAAPPGRRLGHAGAIASNVGESAREKEDVLRQMGVHIASDIASAAQTVAGLLVS